MPALKPSSAAGSAVGQAPNPFPGRLAAHPQPRCIALFRRFECAFASPQTLLGSWQRRWPGSKPLPGTFGCAFLHRSLACESRCISLFRRFESAVCQPSNASRQLAAPLARLQTPSQDLWLSKAFGSDLWQLLCLAKPVHVTLCQASQNLPGASGRDLWPPLCFGKAAACHPLGASKAPFASPQQRRWPGSKPLPETFGCTFLRRSLACESRCVALFRRFSAVCQPSNPPRQLAAPMARLQTPSRTFGCAFLHRSLACESRRISLFRRFESAVCQPSNASRQLAAPLARLQTPSQDLWLSKAFGRDLWRLLCLAKPAHVTLCQASQNLPGASGRDLWPLLCFGKAGACHPLGASKAPFASPQTLLGSWQRRWPGSKPLPETFGCTFLHRSLACESRRISLFRRFESSSNASRQLAAPLATLQTPSQDLWLSKAFYCGRVLARPQTLRGALAWQRRRSLACESRCMSLFRRFESAVCQPSNASRKLAAPLARLQTPSQDLWLSKAFGKVALAKPVQHVTL